MRVVFVPLFVIQHRPSIVKLCDKQKSLTYFDCMLVLLQNVGMQVAVGARISFNLTSKKN